MRQEKKIERGYSPFSLSVFFSPPLTLTSRLLSSFQHSFPSVRLYFSSFVLLGVYVDVRLPFRKKRKAER